MGYCCCCSCSCSGCCCCCCCCCSSWSAGWSVRLALCLWRRRYRMSLCVRIGIRTTQIAGDYRAQILCASPSSERWRKTSLPAAKAAGTRACVCTKSTPVAIRSMCRQFAKEKCYFLCRAAPRHLDQREEPRGLCREGGAAAQGERRPAPRPRRQQQARL